MVQSTIYIFLPPGNPCDSVAISSESDEPRFKTLSFLEVLPTVLLLKMVVGESSATSASKLSTLDEITCEVSAKLWISKATGLWPIFLISCNYTTGKPARR